MIKDIIVKITSGISLENHEQEFLEHVINKPSHKDWSELYLAGLV